MARNENDGSRYLGFGASTVAVELLLRDLLSFLARWVCFLCEHVFMRAWVDKFKGRDISPQGEVWTHCYVKPDALLYRCQRVFFFFFTVPVVLVVLFGACVV